MQIGACSVPSLLARKPGRLLGVVMGALVTHLPPQQQQIVATALEAFFEGPSEAVGAILVDSLQHEQDAANLENGGTHAGGDASAPAGLARPGAGGVGDGEKDKEPVDYPDDLFPLVSDLPPIATLQK